MENIKRKFVDWEKTSKNLKLLRNDNLNLRRYVCKTLYYGKDDCSGDCKGCKYEMDSNISQGELAKVFHVSENMVVNWENNRTNPSLDDLLFYSQICGLDIWDVIVLDNR